MKGRLFIYSISTIAMLTSCDETKEQTITETRPVSHRDQTIKFFASSDERFRNAQPSPVKAPTPHGWLALPAKQFRLLNYRFGDSGLGEAWVSLSSGTVLDNANRWLKQFSAAPLDSAGLDQLKGVTIVKTSGKWIEAEGTYQSGMGTPPASGYALAGVIASVNGQILTVKMVGPKAEVLAAKSTLEEFIGSLEMAK